MKSAWRMNGFTGLLVLLGLAIIGGWAATRELAAVALPAFLILCVAAAGLITVQPNEAKVIIFLGKYMGSIRDSGFFLTIPFAARPRISLRVQNFQSERLKVNDALGSPIEIAAVIVYKVVDETLALFDVEDYKEFIEIQSETALRHLASLYPYDSFEEADLSLRGNTDQIAEDLRIEVQERLKVAGVLVIEARLSHLAYAQEIASAMLQRQQAAAIVSARQKIVEGAVGMVQMALERLKSEDIVELDNERKAAMINNLMVAIVGERAVQPVINAGTLY